MQWVIRNATVIDPARGSGEQADLWVSDGRLAGIGERPFEAGWATVDASGLVLCPGLIDMHVHLRTPGQEHKETIATGTRAAVAGGFTTVLCMPNTDPAIDRPERIHALADRIGTDAACRVGIIGAASLDNRNEQFVDGPEMIRAGCLALTDDAFPIQHDDQMALALGQASRAGVPFIAHCEDKRLSAGGVMNRGCVSEALGVPGQDVASETVAFETWLGALGPQDHLHIAHVSSAGLLERAAGSNVTLETAPHYFALTEDAVREFGADARMNPPLRTEADRLAVRAAVLDGRIPILATDHAPHTPEEKARGLVDAPFGIVGLETAVGVTLTELVHTGEIALADALARMTCNPARIFGLERRMHPGIGALVPGAPADLTLIDPLREWTVDPALFESKGRNTPFAGRKLRGRAWGVMVGGAWRMRDYEVG